MFKYTTLLLAVLLITPAAHAESHDPTMPANLPPAQSADMPNGEIALSLSAIWISDTARHATINGNTVSVGDTLADDSRVLKIRPRYVLIRQNGANKKLYLVQSVKKPVK